MIRLGVAWFNSRMGLPLTSFEVKSSNKDTAYQAEM